MRTGSGPGRSVRITTLVSRVTASAVLQCGRVRAEHGRPDQRNRARLTTGQQCRVPGGTAVGALTNGSGREVLTVSGIFISKLAKTQRSHKEESIEDRTLARSGGRNADLSHDVPRTARRHGSETFSSRSLSLCELCDKYTRSSQHLRCKPGTCRPASAMPAAVTVAGKRTPGGSFGQICDST